MPPARIAEQLGISYQFAYNVLRRAGRLNATDSGSAAAFPEKPRLTAERLIEGGFSNSSAWLLGATGTLELEKAPPRLSGVYAFVVGDKALYIGVTLRTFVERMNLYRRAHESQPSNVAMCAQLVETLATVPRVEIYTIVPGDIEWRGWPISIAAGLEVALIRRYHVPWNRKGI
jgi:hypothetical protein